MKTDTPIAPLYDQSATPWIMTVRSLAQWGNGKIHCFCSTTETWISLDDMSCVRARWVADWLGVLLIRGGYDDMVNEWNMNRGSAQVAVSYRLAAKIDPIR